MPAKSKAQQRFFGMVDAVQKGEMPKKDASKSVRKAADSMTRKEVKKFASTKTNKLPDHVKNEQIERIIKESIRKVLKEDYAPRESQVVAEQLSDMVVGMVSKKIGNNRDLTALISLLIDPRYTLTNHFQISIADLLDNFGGKLYQYMQQYPKSVEMIKEFIGKINKEKIY